MKGTNRISASLKQGRPPLAAQATSKVATASKQRQSSKATRTIIRAHHNLHKSRAKAIARGDAVAVAELDGQIAQLGGLDAYQAASLTGQSKDRGGDSSTLLVSWLAEMGMVGKAVIPEDRNALRVLEVGALSSRNAISGMVGKGVECVRRIDLKSQQPDQIEEIDFMQLPVPSSEAEKFDVVSLSLVLNYVPEATARGEMLKRTRSFLRMQRVGETIPCLFFVLPLPCLSNSRYMTAERLRQMMASIGYTSIRTHQSTKLHYELFHLGSVVKEHVPYTKIEVNPGKGRNNFCVVLNGG